MVWCKSNVLLLISEHQRREEDFRKQSVKKKMLWLKIASEFNKASDGHFSGAQFEQKWKNIT
ncbi:hypothetical protein DPMN_160884 [Dreissena polymorpha]|uniref:Uncharacterized protein n=1 Tax=Dreissena polymorpha TaxID=45954 RepID=A0A9D4IS25_DREPO|nr:hypothetical protein DPMN_160884 [Dreissena polymorpha]